MKKTILILSLLTLLLTGCNNSSNNNSDSGNADSDNTSDTDTDKGGDSDSDSEFKFDDRLLGQWYVNSSTFGVVSINHPFIVYSNQTVYFGEQYYRCIGYFEEFTNAYQFVYGSYQLILSYGENSTEDELDWGYMHGDDVDIGFALRTENKSGSYDYVGENWPMKEINAALGTSGNIPAIESDMYYLDIFTSPLYKCTSAGIEIKESTLDAMKSYLDSLVDIGYTFTNYISTNIRSNTFYFGYDSDKIYSFRINYLSEKSEIDIFVYKYNENIKP